MARWYVVPWRFRAVNVIRIVTFVAKKETDLFVTFSAAFAISTARIKWKSSVRNFNLKRHTVDLPVKASPTLLKHHFDLTHFSMGITIPKIIKCKQIKNKKKVLGLVIMRCKLTVNRRRPFFASDRTNRKWKSKYAIVMKGTVKLKRRISFI